jgi:hypothetical protein
MCSTVHPRHTTTRYWYGIQYQHFHRIVYYYVICDLFLIETIKHMSILKKY